MSRNSQGRLKHLSVLLCIVCSLSALTIGQQQTPRVPPSVYLNHLYIVLDQKTYDDIAASEFLRNEFASFEQKTTLADGGKSWTGIYLRGEQTYLEFFNSENKQGVELAKGAIAFGVEEAGAIKLIQNQLNQVGGKVKGEFTTRKIGERQVPWFYLVYVEYPEATLEFDRWVMEYHKDYQRERYSDLKAKENGITRKQVLMRDYRPERYLKNISEITVALNERETRRFANELAAFNFKIETRGAKKICSGSDVKIIIIPQTETEGIKELKLTLSQKKKGQKIYKFGARSVLRFNGKTAAWSF